MTQENTTSRYGQIPAGKTRAELSADLSAKTGLNDEVLTSLVHKFYDKIRLDPLLGPIFADNIADWVPHLAKMVDFWSSITLMTGRYHGQPMEKHFPLPVEVAHFERWLELFRKTAREVCTPEGAEHVIFRAEKIAGAFHSNIVESRAGFGLNGIPPNLRGAK